LKRLIVLVYFSFTLQLLLALNANDVFFAASASTKIQNQKFGSIQVTSKPDGMVIHLNDQNTGKITPYTFNGIETGDYTIKLTNQWYQTQTKKVSVFDERTVPVNFIMKSLFAELTINATTEATIYINGSRVSLTSWTGRVMEGICKVKVEKVGYATQEFQLAIIAGKNQKLDIKLKAETGELEVTSEPQGAVVTIDGTIYGLTPIKIPSLPEKRYVVYIAKKGYTTVIKSVDVVGRKFTKIDVVLYSGKQVAVTSEPSGAQIFIGDSLYGNTPKSIWLEYGEYLFKITKGNKVIVEKVTISFTSSATHSFILKDSNDPLDQYMVLVKGGTFKMGDTFGEGKKFEKPVHDVTVSDFYISNYEITQALWKEIMGTSPSHFRDCNQCPVERVSWHDAQNFIKKLNVLTGKNYRLPTEAEWEYAARGGEKTQNHRYSGARNINDVAWYSGNSGNKTNEVGQLKPNELGIYDMSGNVWEWCNDWFSSYSSTTETNPKGPETGDGRVVRGGSWFGYIDANRLTFRGFDDPSNSRSYIGFRIVLPTVNE